MTIQDYKSGIHIGMHGLGMLYGIPHSNIKEAYRYWRSKYVLFFEADIAVTDDNCLILLAHNASEKDLNKLEVFVKPEDGHYTVNWIKSIPSHPGFLNRKCTILTLEEFLDIAGQDDQIIIMLDTYGRNFNDILNITSLIMTYEIKYPGLIDRILLELYTLNEIKQIKLRYEELHIIACIKEEKYNFWNCSKDYSSLKMVDFISCKWKYFDQEAEIIRYCNENTIGVLSLSRFDNNMKEKKRAGVNINLVDVYGKNNWLIYFRNVFSFCLHIGRILIKKD